MDERLPALAEQLLLIERELRRQGMWSDTAPDAEALASTEPFCVDTLSFESWLQWILLPRMKMLIEAGAPLPAASGIREMGEEVYGASGQQVGALLELLGGFDSLIGQNGRA